MNLMITGALGHIGSRFICKIPVGLFQKVYLLDNLSTQRYSALFNLPEGIPFCFFEEDILTADLERYFDHIDVVIHLAAITNAEASVSIPDKVELVNFKGTERVAKACVRCGTKMIFVSTTSVYGVQQDEVNEDCPIDQLRPQSPYAASKLKAELVLQDIGKKEGLEFAICRFGTVFGVSSGMRFHTAINKFIWQACVGLPLTVWLTAMDQKRPYLDLEDAIDALRFIIHKDLFDKQIYNVVTVNTSVGKIIDIIRSFLPDIAIQYVRSEIMNQLSYTVSSQRFKSRGFQFKGKLDKGIYEIVQLLQNIRS